jgi:hypothetical protein
MTLTYTLSTPPALGSITFDAVTREAPAYTAEITTNPVEAGISNTDNVRPKPIELSLDVTITDFALSQEGGGSGAVRFTGYAETALATLVSLQAGGVRCTLENDVRVYSNMVISSISPPRERAHKGALRVALKLTEVRTATTLTVPLAKVAQPKARPPTTNDHHPTGEGATVAPSYVKQIGRLAAPAAQAAWDYLGSP